MPVATNNKKRVLVAPLDWGLGHTTRCIPIINQLLKHEVTVLIACNEWQKAVLSKEFPHCAFLHIPGYNIRYARSKTGLLLKLITQVPKILRSIQRENNWLKMAIKQYQVDGVISDNRFGLHHKKIPCAFVTHQLLIKNPMGRYFEKILQKLNYSKINRFSECWIADYPGVPNLAGNLSHPRNKPVIPCWYIGPLSRMQSIQETKKDNRILIVISGPEPQRSAFEEIVFSQVPFYDPTVTIVRGLPTEKGNSSDVKNATIFNYLGTSQLNKEFNHASFIICRSGYSSVMDVHAIGARAIFIPTPGQTEQEYLADYLQEQHFAISCPQAHFSLPDMIEKAEKFEYRQIAQNGNGLLEDRIRMFLQQCG